MRWSVRSKVAMVRYSCCGSGGAVTVACLYSAIELITVALLLPAQAAEILGLQAGLG